MENQAKDVKEYVLQLIKELNKSGNDDPQEKAAKTKAFL